jgi:hypothetical protein
MSKPCKHQKNKYNCKKCKGGGICKHNIHRAYCKDCHGSQVCKHKKFKGFCKRCNSKNICKHDRHKWQCKECGGLVILAKAMYYGARKRAARDKQPFNLTKKHILKLIGNGICPVFNVPYNLASRVACDTSAALDKIVPNLGYTKRNCVVISSLANRIKTNATSFKQILRVAEWMKDIFEERGL